MKMWKQLSLAGLLVVAGAVIWAAYVPAAQPIFDRIGATPLLERVGLGAGGGAADAPGRPGGGGPPGGFRGGGPVEVVGRPATLATVNDRVTAIGDGRAARSVVVTPLVSGRIASIEARSGHYVQAGDLLITLDSEAEAIALDRARLALEDAEATMARLERLSRSGATTEVQLREARLALRNAELQLRDAEFELDRRRIAAPIAGWVGILNAEIGNQVSQTTEVAVIDDRSTILVDFRVPERFVGRISSGDRVSASPLAQPDLLLDGVVSALDNRVDPETRTLRVRAELDNVDDRLRAGMAFTITISLPGDRYPAVDPLAIQWSNEGAYVWVRREGAATRVPVTIVQRSNELVLISAAIEDGEMVVTEGVQLLREGAPMRFRGERDEREDGAMPISRADPARSET